MFWAKLRSREARRRRRRIVAVRAAVVLLGVAFLCALLYKGLTYPRIQIAHIDVVGAQTFSEEEIEIFALEFLTGSYLGLIPYTSAPLYPRSALIRELRTAFPRIDTVNVTRRGPNELAISLRERTPYALWCGDIVPLPRSTEFQGTCYFVDAGGFVFAKAPRFSGSPLARFYGSLTQGREVGQQFVAPNEFADLTRFVEILTMRDVPVVGLLVVDERDLELYHASGARFLVRRGDTYAHVADAIELILQDPRLAGDALFSVDYIDMRFGNKIYLKETEIQS